MKRSLFVFMMTLTSCYVHAQKTNNFPETGFVGIGTTNPSEILTIRDPAIPYDANTGIVKIRFDSGGGGGGFGFEKETYNTGGLRFYTQYGFRSMIEQLRITGNGNVGIGTTAPDAKLTVNGLIHSKEVKVNVNICLTMYSTTITTPLRLLRQKNTFRQINIFLKYHLLPR